MMSDQIKNPLEVGEEWAELDSGLGGEPVDPAGVVIQPEEHVQLQEKSPVKSNRGRKKISDKMPDDSLHQYHFFIKKSLLRKLRVKAAMMQMSPPQLIFSLLEDYLKDID